MTEGDHVNCKCPNCGKNNTYVTQGVVVIRNEITGFVKECRHCKKKFATWRAGKSKSKPTKKARFNLT